MASLGSVTTQRLFALVEPPPGQIARLLAQREGGNLRQGIESQGGWDRALRPDAGGGLEIGETFAPPLVLAGLERPGDAVAPQEVEAPLKHRQRLGLLGSSQSGGEPFASQ